MEYLAVLLFIIGVIFLLTRKSKADEVQQEMYGFTRKLDRILNEIIAINQKLDNLNLKEESISELKADLQVLEKEIIIPDQPLESTEVVTPEVVAPIEIKEEFIQKPERKAESRPSYQETVRTLPEKGFWEKFMENNPDLEKFVGENLMPKIGIVILVLGVSFLVKLAIDKDWINESCRVGVGIICGLILLGFSYYLHKSYKGFSSILVAGAITVFYFTIAYGFHVYQLYSQTTAFIIMVVITAFSTLVSVFYDRQELGILSVIGAFLVPFMVSTGDGNYIVLFTYIAIINIGMMILSYLKDWNIVKVLSFLFTQMIYLSWFIVKYPNIPTAFNNTILFINGFYLIFLIVNVVDILKNRLGNLGLKVSFMLMNTASVYFVTMSILSIHYPQWKGAYTLLISLINLVVTYIVYRRNTENKNIIYVLLGLTMTFATLAIPVQFDGYYITLFWAGEALILLWLAQKSRHDSFFTASVIVYLLTMVSLVMDWGRYNSDTVYPIVFNSIFMTGIIVNISVYIASYLLRKNPMNLAFSEISFFNSNLFLVVAAILTYGVGFYEVQYQSRSTMQILYCPQSILMSYHYVLTTVAILFFARFSDKKFIISIGLSVLNLVLFIMFNAYQPFYEMVASISNSKLDSIGFYANFVYVLCILISIIVLVRKYANASRFYLFSKNILISSLLIFIVFLLSNQLLMYIMKYNLIPKDNFFQTYYDLETKLYKVLFPIIWGSLSLIYLAYGIRIKSRMIRVVALSLIFITVVKLFFYDLSTSSEGGKIVAVIILGILMLIMAFMYQKIKKLVTDDSGKLEE